jgi:hypothetical protein
MTRDLIEQVLEFEFDVEVNVYNVKVIETYYKEDMTNEDLITIQDLLR